MGKRYKGFALIFYEETCYNFKKKFRIPFFIEYSFYFIILNGSFNEFSLFKRA